MRYLVAIIFVFLVGCAGTNFSWDNARKLKLGMNETEVVELMGPPNHINSSTNGTIWVWVWVNLYSQTKTLTVTMKDGVLTKIPDIPKTYQ
jgi:hypothetical protein